MKMGQQDLIVSKKRKETGSIYEELLVDMDKLPPINLTKPQTPVTDSPPGRPGHREEDSSRKRTRSGLSSNGASPNTKVS